MFGSGYVIDYCIATYANMQRQKSYQIYVTDMLSSVVAGLGAKNVPRWYDLAYGQQKAIEEKSAADIVADITRRAGLKVVNKHGSDELAGEIDA